MKIVVANGKRRLVIAESELSSGGVVAVVGWS
jgi:hypothetical protein